MVCSLTVAVAIKVIPSVWLQPTNLMAFSCKVVKYFQLIQSQLCIQTYVYRLIYIESHWSNAKDENSLSGLIEIYCQLWLRPSFANHGYPVSCWVPLDVLSDYLCHLYIQVFEMNTIIAMMYLLVPNGLRKLANR